MGALDGIRIPCAAVSGGDAVGRYVKGQPDFRFTRDFTIDDLASRIDDAKRIGCEHVYVKSHIPGLSGARLDLWYAEALMRQLDRTS